MANYLEVEGLLTARLEANVAGVRVYTAPDVTSVVDAGDPLPAIYVVYAGDQVVSTQRYGKIGETIDQRWIIALKYGHAGDSRSGAKARAGAGLILDDILTAMRDYAPSSSYQMFLRTSDLPPLYDGSRTYVFPIQYLLRVD